MRSNRWRLTLGWFALIPIVACGKEKPLAVSGNEVSADIRNAAITLSQAIIDKLVEVKPLDALSTKTNLTMMLSTKTSTQPWIWIRPGWQARNGRRQKDTYVTYRSLYVRLPETGNYTVNIPHLQMHRIRSIGIPRNSTLSRVADRRVFRFLQAVDELPWTTTRKVLQIATWSITDNIEYADFRPSPDAGIEKVLADPRVVSGSQLQTIGVILERAGEDKEEITLWISALDELALLIEEYEILDDLGDPKALGRFKRIGVMYPFESAADVVVGSFDRHAGPTGLAFRSYAIKVLGQHGGSRERLILKEKINFEDDDNLYEQMAKYLAAPPR